MTKSVANFTFLLNIWFHIINYEAKSRLTRDSEINGRGRQKVYRIGLFSLAKKEIRQNWMVHRILWLHASRLSLLNNFQSAKL